MTHPARSGRVRLAERRPLPNVGTTMQSDDSRVPRLDRSAIDDRELLDVLDRAEQLSTPRPDWYLTLAHAPDMAVAYSRYWDLTHRGGRVDHRIKEKMRLAVSTALGCDFCAEQRSTVALEGGLTDAEAEACAMPAPEFDDPRESAAVRYARALVDDRPEAPVDWDDVYARLRGVFDDAEVVELGCFAAIAVGGVKLSRSYTDAVRAPQS